MALFLILLHEIKSKSIIAYSIFSLDIGNPFLPIDSIDQFPNQDLVEDFHALYLFHSSDQSKHITSDTQA